MAPRKAESAVSCKHAAWRQAFVGEQCEGMSFAKSWRSLPIHSWSGGVKLVDVAGARPNRTGVGILSKLLCEEVQAAAAQMLNNIL